MKILTVNSGSSSLKFSIYKMYTLTEKLERKGELSDIGQGHGNFSVEDGEGKQLVQKHQKIQDHTEALNILFEWINEDSPEEDITAAGHRIVHGGSKYREPVLLNRKELENFEELIPLAPEHLPHEIKAIKIMMENDPNLKQAACFDTGFHRNMPVPAQRYPLPAKYWHEGVKRYGFHGLSYEYILQELVKEAGSEILRDRIIIAHLGNGASMAAVKNGMSIDTTMGLTPAGGLIMSTRTGDLDPGVIIYLMNEKGMNITGVNKLANENSGLLGISGISSSMKDLLENKKEDAELAIEMFCYQARKYLGALAGTLGGLDTLIFTAGIGENSPEIRNRICINSEYLGIEIDLERNNGNDKIISSVDSPVTVRVMKTNEELMIARHTRNLIESTR